jgi:methylmalonyl-CoA mutase N-terminal domain/subunit
LPNDAGEWVAWSNNSEPNEKSLARIIKQTGFNRRDPFNNVARTCIEARALLEELNLYIPILDEAINLPTRVSLKLQETHGFYQGRN